MPSMGDLHVVIDSCAQPIRFLILSGSMQHACIDMKGATAIGREVSISSPKGRGEV
jgi:hypothetical protein